LSAATIGKREPVSDRRPPMKAGSPQPGPAAAKTGAGSRDFPIRRHSGAREARTRNPSGRSLG